VKKELLTLPEQPSSRGYQEGRVEITLTDLTPSDICSCPKTKKDRQHNGKIKRTKGQTTIYKKYT
jgi:hypothetical protein